MEINTYESEKDKLGANELEQFQDVSKEQVESFVVGDPKNLR